MPCHGHSEHLGPLPYGLSSLLIKVGRSPVQSPLPTAVIHDEKKREVIAISDLEVEIVPGSEDLDGRIQRY